MKRQKVCDIINMPKGSGREKQNIFHKKIAFTFAKGNS